MDLRPSADALSEDNHPDVVLQEIIKALRDLQFGQVTLIVQDGRIVQIDRMEKRRLLSVGSTSAARS